MNPGDADKPKTTREKKCPECGSEKVIHTGSVGSGAFGGRCLIRQDACSSARTAEKGFFTRGRPLERKNLLIDMNAFLAYRDDGERPSRGRGRGSPPVTQSG
jgi:hypothetical protein